MMPEKEVLKKELIDAIVLLNKLTQRLMYELQTCKGDLSPAIMCRLVENLTNAETIMRASCGMMLDEMFRTRHPSTVSAE